MLVPTGPSKTGAIGQRYGLEPPSESVLQLTRLVGRQEASTEEIARIVAKDKAITARLLRLANPRADSEEDYTATTVEEALLRTGMAPLILLAMLDPLIRAVIRAFEMFHTPLTPAPLKTLRSSTGEQVVGEVEFSGKATGLVNVRLPALFAQRLAATIIGVEPGQLTDPAEIDDVIGELVNMIVGNLKSNLCDAGMACKLSIPRVSRASDFQKAKVSGGTSERLGFLSCDFQAVVDVSVNPWGD